VGRRKKPRLLDHEKDPAAARSRSVAAGGEGEAKSPDGEKREFVQSISREQKKKKIRSVPLFPYFQTQRKRGGKKKRKNGSPRKNLKKRRRKRPCAPPPSTFSRPIRKKKKKREKITEPRPFS